MNHKESHTVYKLNDRVFAKMKTYPTWPAKIIEIFDKDKYKVIFYGTHDFGIITKDNLIKYEYMKKQNLPKSKLKTYLLALKEIKDDVNNKLFHFEHFKSRNKAKKSISVTKTNATARTKTKRKNNDAGDNDVVSKKPKNQRTYDFSKFSPSEMYLECKTHEDIPIKLHITSVLTEAILSTLPDYHKDPYMWKMIVLSTVEFMKNKIIKGEQVPSEIQALVDNIVKEYKTAVRSQKSFEPCTSSFSTSYYKSQYDIKTNKSDIKEEVEEEKEEGEIDKCNEISIDENVTHDLKIEKNIQSEETIENKVLQDIEYKFDVQSTDEENIEAHDSVMKINETEKCKIISDNDKLENAESEIGQHLDKNKKEFVEPQTFHKQKIKISNKTGEQDKGEKYKTEKQQKAVSLKKKNKINKGKIIKINNRKNKIIEKIKLEKVIEEKNIFKIQQEIQKQKNEYNKSLVNPKINNKNNNQKEKSMIEPLPEKDIEQRDNKLQGDIKVQNFVSIDHVYCKLPDITESNMHHKVMCSKDNDVQKYENTEEIFDGRTKRNDNDLLEHNNHIKETNIDIIVEDIEICNTSDLVDKSNSSIKKDYNNYAENVINHDFIENKISHSFPHKIDNPLDLCADNMTEIVDNFETVSHKQVNNSLSENEKVNTTNSVNRQVNDLTSFPEEKYPETVNSSYENKKDVSSYEDKKDVEKDKKDVHNIESVNNSDRNDAINNEGRPLSDNINKTLKSSSTLQDSVANVNIIDKLLPEEMKTPNNNTVSKGEKDITLDGNRKKEHSITLQQVNDSIDNTFNKSDDSKESFNTSSKNGKDTIKSTSISNLHSESEVFHNKTDKYSNYLNENHNNNDLSKGKEVKTSDFVIKKASYTEHEINNNGPLQKFQSSEGKVITTTDKIKETIDDSNYLKQEVNAMNIDYKHTTKLESVNEEVENSNSINEQVIESNKPVPLLDPAIDLSSNSYHKKYEKNVISEINKAPIVKFDTISKELKISTSLNELNSDSHIIQTTNSVIENTSNFSSKVETSNFHNTNTNVSSVNESNTSLRKSINNDNSKTPNSKCIPFNKNVNKPETIKCNDKLKQSSNNFDYTNKLKETLMASNKIDTLYKEIPKKNTHGKNMNNYENSSRINKSYANNNTVENKNNVPDPAVGNFDAFLAAINIGIMNEEDIGSESIDEATHSRNEKIKSNALLNKDNAFDRKGTSFVNSNENFNSYGHTIADRRVGQSYEIRNKMGYDFENNIKLGSDSYNNINRVYHQPSYRGMSNVVEDKVKVAMTHFDTNVQNDYSIKTQREPHLMYQRKEGNLSSFDQRKMCSVMQKEPRQSSFITSHLDDRNQHQVIQAIETPSMNQRTVTDRKKIFPVDQSTTSFDQRRPQFMNTKESFSLDQGRSASISQYPSGSNHGHTYKETHSQFYQDKQKVDPKNFITFDECNQILGNTKEDMHIWDSLDCLDFNIKGNSNVQTNMQQYLPMQDKTMHDNRTQYNMSNTAGLRDNAMPKIHNESKLRSTQDNTITGMYDTVNNNMLHKPIPTYGIGAPSYNNPMYSAFSTISQGINNNQSTPLSNCNLQNNTNYKIEDSTCNFQNTSSDLLHTNYNIQNTNPNNKESTLYQQNATYASYGVQNYTVHTQNINYYTQCKHDYNDSFVDNYENISYDNSKNYSKYLNKNTKRNDLNEIDRNDLVNKIFQGECRALALHIKILENLRFNKNEQTYCNEENLKKAHEALAEIISLKLNPIILLRNPHIVFTCRLITTCSRDLVDQSKISLSSSNDTNNNSTIIDYKKKFSTYIQARSLENLANQFLMYIAKCFQFNGNTDFYDQFCHELSNYHVSSRDMGWADAIGMFENLI